MKTFSTLLFAFFGITGVMAGCNCKCQDPSGTGPQWNALTERACDRANGEESGLCVANKVYHADQHHQCSSSTCCIDSGAFDEECRVMGAPGAYCWD